MMRRGCRVLELKQMMRSFLVPTATVLLSSHTCAGCHHTSLPSSSHPASAGHDAKQKAQQYASTTLMRRDVAPDGVHVAQTLSTLPHHARLGRLPQREAGIQVDMNAAHQRCLASFGTD